MVGMGESYLAAFVLALGLGEVAAGLIATAPLLAGGAIQLVTPYGVQIIGSRRRWTILCAWLQASAFVPLVIGAIHGRLPVWAVFAVASYYWAAGMAAGPAWNVWVESIVPRLLRARYFARRTSAIQLGILLALIIGGVVLNGAKESGHPLIGFAVIFAVAGVFRVASARILAIQSEPSTTFAPGSSALGGLRLLLRFPRGPGGKLLAYILVLTAGVAIASPYFSPYMLSHLDFSYARYMILVGTAMLAKVLVLTRVAAMAHRVGLVTMLRVAWAGIVFAPGLWIVSDAYPYLLCLQVFAGSVWAVHEYATFLLLFDTIHAHRRVVILTAFNFGIAVVTVSGSLVGAWLFGVVGGGSRAYFTLFLLSSAWRAVCLVLLARIPISRLAPRRSVLRPVAVRPGIGTVLGPILATMRRRNANRRRRDRADTDRSGTGS